MATVLLCDDSALVRETLHRALVAVPGVTRVVDVGSGVADGTGVGAAVIAGSVTAFVLTRHPDTACSGAGYTCVEVH